MVCRTSYGLITAVLLIAVTLAAINSVSAGADCSTKCQSCPEEDSNTCLVSCAAVGAELFDCKGGVNPIVKRGFTERGKRGNV